MMMNASSCLSKSPRKFVALHLPKSPLEANSNKMMENITISLRTSYPMNHHESKVVTYIYNVYMPPLLRGISSENIPTCSLYHNS